MILTLISAGTLLLGIIIIIIGWGIDKAALSSFGGFIAILGVIASSICCFFIISAHVRVDCHIYDNEIKYEKLCKSFEIADSVYEDMSQTVIINDDVTCRRIFALENIVDWNKMVYYKKYEAKSPWSSWFYSQREVDALKYIDIN